MKNPRHDTRFEKYKTLLLRYISPASTQGLEIGALDLPFVTSDEGNVKYADCATTEELRERARVAPGHSPDFVVPVDFVLQDGGWDSVVGEYDWIAAAHVIEHAPSLIDWLRSAGSKLKEGGVLFLVIPDKRYTFDFYRPESTLGKIFEDHILKKQKPGIAEVFDGRYYSRNVNPIEIWKNPIKVEFDAQSTGRALDVAKTAANDYIDVHCNIFCDKSFSLIMKTLCLEGWVPFNVEEVGSVDQFGSDFHCVLKKIVRS
jgi:hypothetical protein